MSILKELLFWPAALIVGLLGAVGVTSHMTAASSGPLHDALNGALQSRYEAQFDAANPLQHTAIALFGAVKWAVFGDGTAEVVVGQEGWLFTAEEFALPPDAAARLQRNTAHVVEVARDLSASGQLLIVLAVPDKAQIYHDKLTRHRPAAVVQRHARLVSMLQASGVIVVDAAAALQDTRQDHDSFQRDDTHWTPQGARAVARSLSQKLAPFDHLLTSQVVETHYAGHQPHDGDLLSFVPTGAFRPWVGPAQSEIATFKTEVAARGGLFSDDVVNLALVGTSFSAKPDWHFAGFLKTALQTDLVNYAAQGGGPFTPMAAMRASDDFQNQGAKVVIWEIPTRYLTTQEPT
ncbi:MAG: hypothetical protein AAF218_04800 [Pseudomonadota bacterium]